MAAGEVLQVLFLGGLLGLFGQGARAIVGLKTLSDYASSPNPTEADVFNAARLIISLIIGFIAGIAAALAFEIAGGDSAKINGQTLLGFAGAGYVGTDVIEAFIGKYFDNLKSSSAQPLEVSTVSSGSNSGTQLIDYALVRKSPTGPQPNDPTALPGSVNLKTKPLAQADIRVKILAVAGTQYDPSNTPDTTGITSLGFTPWLFAEMCMEDCEQFKSDGLILLPIYVNKYCSKIGDFVNAIRWCYLHPGLAEPEV